MRTYGTYGNDSGQYADPMPFSIRKHGNAWFLFDGDSVLAKADCHEEAQAYASDLIAELRLIGPISDYVDGYAEDSL